MSSPDEVIRNLDAQCSGLRVGAPEREAAREALEAHLDAERIDATEFEERWAACRNARTRADLLPIFADLPEPHPELPGPPDLSGEPDEDPPAIALAICVALLLGLPVTVVLGFVYGAWWTLAVPVAVSVAILYIEHLLTRGRDIRPGEPHLDQ